MMYKLSATLCDIPINIFLPRGFFNYTTSVTPLHRHYYTEVHIIYEGHASYDIGTKRYELNKGEFLVIPPHRMHTCFSVDPDTLHSSFLFDANVGTVTHGSLSPQIAGQLMQEIPRAKDYNDYFGITGYISLILSKVLTGTRISVDELLDDAFIIDNYIERHYASSPSLAELAVRLKRSEKQAARLVLSHKGASFSEVIAEKRIRTAELLKRTTDMSLKEISEYVGYSSYSGFYKAYKKTYSEISKNKSPDK